jgi:hypothetical protein
LDEDSAPQVPNEDNPTITDATAPMANKGGGTYITPSKPRTGSRRLLYAGSSKESSDAAPSYRTVIANRQIDVMAH